MLGQVFLLCPGLLQRLHKRGLFELKGGRGSSADAADVLGTLVAVALGTLVAVAHVVL